MRHMKDHLRPIGSSIAISLIGLFPFAVTPAAELTVRVNGMDTVPKAMVGCALFSSPSGFPMDSSTANQIWVPAQAGGVECRFPALHAGRYAVAVSHDLNGNRRLDTNFFGIPVEAWGVSNNMRPTLRAPRFDEAAFTLSADQVLSIDVQVAK